MVRGAFAAGHDQVLDQVERALIGPVDVFEQHDGAHLVGHGSEEIGRCTKGAVSQLARIVENVCQIVTRAHVETDEVTQERSTLATGWTKELREACLELGQGDRAGIVVGDLESREHDVANEGVGNDLTLLVRPSLEQPDAARLQPQPVLEFVQQTRLADACLTHHRDEAGAAPFHRTLHQVSQRSQLGIAADHTCLDPFQAARRQAKGAGQHTVHDVGDQRIILAFHLQRRLRIHREDAAHVPVGVVADEHASHGSGSFEPGGHVHRVANGGVFRGCPDVAEQNGSRVDPDPYRGGRRHRQREVQRDRRRPLEWRALP